MYALAQSTNIGYVARAVCHNARTNNMQHGSEFEDGACSASKHESHKPRKIMFWHPGMSPCPQPLKDFLDAGVIAPTRTNRPFWKLKTTESMSEVLRSALS